MKADRLDEEGFWRHPLGEWLSSCISGPSSVVAEWRSPAQRDQPLRYSQLCDGYALSLLYKAIDPDWLDALLVESEAELREWPTRQRLLLALLDALRRFYRVRLDQLVTIGPAEVAVILRRPTPDGSGRELNRFVLLLLGCAVQGDQKSIFISLIRKQRQELQNQIAFHIQELTSSGSSLLVSIPSFPDRLVTQLESAMRERDEFARIHMDTIATEESSDGSSTTPSSINGDLPRRGDLRYDGRSPSPPNDRQPSKIELREMRKLKNEVEEKDEIIVELRDELENNHKDILRLQEERPQLLKDARLVKDLQDELECANRELEKLEKMKAENSRLRDKIGDLEFYKNRAEQLTRENDQLERASQEWEAELEEMRLKGKLHLETQHRLTESQETVRELQQEIAQKNAHTERLVLECSQLEKQVAEASARSAEMERRLLHPTPRSPTFSLADQLGEDDREEVRRLKKENRQLKEKLECSLADCSTATLVSLDCSAEEQREQEKEEILEECELKMELLNSQLEKVKADLADSIEEKTLITGQLHSFEKKLSELSGQHRVVVEERDSLIGERDSALSSLHDARRNFAMFQTDACKQIENEAGKKVRELESELREAQHRLESSEDERIDRETQLEKMRIERKTLREQVDTLQDEVVEKTRLLEQSERARKTIDGERAAIKEKLSTLHSQLDSLRLSTLSSSSAEERLQHTEKELVLTASTLGDTQAELRTVKQQLELECSKTACLREELAVERRRLADLLGRLRSLCTTIKANGASLNEQQDDEEFIASIESILLSVLADARREADANRILQHTQMQELDALKADIHKLRRGANESLSESDDRVRTLTEENAAVNKELSCLREKVHSQQIALAAAHSDLASAKREREETVTSIVDSNKTSCELARLQVSLRNAQLQEDLLKQDNSELRVQLELAEKIKKEIKRDHDSLVVLHESLLREQERLRALHEALSIDFERTTFDLNDMRSKWRAAEKPDRELADLRAQLVAERTRADREMAERCAEWSSQQARERREGDALRRENECLQRNMDALNEEIRKLRTADNAHKATIAALNTTIDRLTRQLRDQELEAERLRSKIEMLTSLSTSLDEESKCLTRQVEMLIQQNGQLTERVISDKDSHHNQQREFQDKLSALRRHKEQLEEKIMQQYRDMNSRSSAHNGSSHSARSGSGTLVKRVSKALGRKTRSDKHSTGSTTEDSSAYSADEAPSSARHYSNDADLVPTCSSSEDADRVSPRYETILAPKPNPSHAGLFSRQRGDLVGGSVRALPGLRYGQYQQPDLPSHLPPRPPMRLAPHTSSLRVRAPPPPYQARNPPAYQNRTSTPIQGEFLPQCASTPKGSCVDESMLETAREYSRDSANRVVAEGERREFIRDKEERVDKAMSVYENVPKDSTMWYEYGCV